MENKNLKWIYLLILSFVWGSSYILIKKALIGLSPLQVGSLRTIISTVLLLAIGYSSLKSIPRDKWKWILITGLVSFIPPFLFAYAQTEIDSALAAILNSLTPLATLLIGVGFYRFKIDSKQISGVIIGLIGSVLLMYQGSVINPDQNLLYVFFIIFASVLYAVQVNLLKVHLPIDKSPVIDAGDTTCDVDFDQLGSKRPIDGDSNNSTACDIGAIEFNPIIDFIFDNGFELEE